MTTPLALVAAPLPEVAPYGLLSLGDPVSDGDDRWAGGYSYESLVCNARVTLTDLCDSAQNVVISERDTANRVLEQRPVVISVEDECSTFGFGAREREQRALAAMEQCTQKALEYELWTGALGTLAGHANRRLASPSAVDVTPTPGTAVKVRYGLALLEQALANTGCGVRGVIHATRAVASAIGGRDENGKLLTGLGNYIVAGTGYPGTGPTGTLPAAGVWMYATGPVTYRLDDPFVPNDQMRERVDTSKNTLLTRAFRTASAEFDGCAHFGVLVDLTLDYA